MCALVEQVLKFKSYYTLINDYAYHEWCLLFRKKTLNQSYLMNKGNNLKGLFQVLITEEMVIDEPRNHNTHKQTQKYFNHLVHGYKT